MWSDRVCSGNGSATAASLLQRAPAARITFTTRAASPEVLALLGLEARGADRFGEYSFGMKQRLGIAAALLGDPALLVLDEPTNGLDPAGICGRSSAPSRTAIGPCWSRRTS
jgi:ABC-type Mn2+/Zn2+ transport system ATPase subunit